jgi:hypothetical protein
MRLSFVGIFEFLQLVKTSTKLKSHIVSIFVEFFGTLFVWLDTKRLDARAPTSGFTLGDPHGFGSLGFLLIFCGIIVQAFLIFFHDAELENIDKRIKDLESLALPKESPSKSIQNEDSWSI